MTQPADLLRPHAPPPLPAQAATPTIALIIIGDEILSGKRQDKHLPRVIELLAARGLALAWADYLGDEPARITATLRRAFDQTARHGDVVFCTGGIGATPDDHTRACAARALGLPLALHPQAAALIHERAQDVARDQGKTYDPHRPDNIHRLNMGVFPLGADIIPNPYNKIPGFTCWAPPCPTPQRTKTAPSTPPSSYGAPKQGAPKPGGIHFLPGFPVMAWPMIEWVLDQHYPHLHQTSAQAEHSIIVLSASEAALTPLMQHIEATHPNIKVFSLPSVSHPEWGTHIDLGVKGPPTAVPPAFADLIAGLQALGMKLGPQMQR